MGRRGRVDRVFKAAAVAGLLAAGVFAVVPGQALAADAKPGLPTEMAAYSYLTGNVTSAPPGRAVALWQYGFGVEFMDFPQAVVLGASGDVYRRLDVAEGRHGAETQGDPGPMLLSPDGTKAAVGHYDIDPPDLAVVDLATGDVTTHPLPEGHSVIPLAWSPDSTRLAYGASTGPDNPYSGDPRWPVGSRLSVVDTTSGAVTKLPVTDYAAVAFAPIGTDVAVETPGSIRVLDATGAERRRLPLPAERHLAGPSAWSPDGRLLAITRPMTTCFDPADYVDPSGLVQDCDPSTDGLSFVDATGTGAAVPRPLKGDLSGTRDVLGWTSPTEVIVMDDLTAPTSPDSTDEKHWVTAVSVDGQQSRRLMSVPDDGNYGVGRFHLASALAPDLEVRPAGSADRGTWPTVVRIGAIAAALGLLVSYARSAWRGRQRARRRAAYRAARLAAADTVAGHPASAP
jgi:hypothetical protein